MTHLEHMALEFSAKAFHETSGLQSRLLNLKLLRLCSKQHESILLLLCFSPVRSCTISGALKVSHGC